MTSTPSNTLPATVYHPENAHYRPCFGGLAELILSGKQTNGWLSFWFMLIPPDNGPPLHRHHYEDEVFIVMEGSFEFLCDGRRIEGGPGTTVFLPRHVPHTFRNIGIDTGKIGVLANPARLESFFPLCETPFHQPDGPDFEKITAIAADHGIEFL